MISYYTVHSSDCNFNDSINSSSFWNSFHNTALTSSSWSSKNKIRERSWWETGYSHFSQRPSVLSSFSSLSYFPQSAPAFPSGILPSRADPGLTTIRWESIAQCLPETGYDHFGHRPSVLSSFSSNNKMKEHPAKLVGNCYHKLSVLFSFSSVSYFPSAPPFPSGVL